mgnify:FL=1
MKKILYFFLISIIFVFLFDVKILSYFLSKKLSDWTEYNSEINISNLNYFKGELEIDKIKIKNLKNFESNIFDAKLITIDFDFKSLFSNLVILNKVTIIEPIIYFNIKDKDSNSNLNKKKVIDNLNIIDSSSEDNLPKIYPLKKRDKNFLISNLIIENSKAIIKYQKNIKDLHIDLSNIAFNNIGNAGKEKGDNFQHYKDVVKLILIDIFFKIPDYNLRKMIKENYKIEK